MPHVVVEGKVTAVRVHLEVEPFEERREGVILKLRESFLARSGKMVLLEAIVVEGTTRRFFVAVDEHEASLTVRLFPLTDPEKTDGVKRMLAAVARRVRALDPGARFGKTNLTPFLAGGEA